MDQKVDLVIDSIKKLLALSVSEEEIIKELSGVGIDRDEAIKLIATSKEINVSVDSANVSQKDSSSKDIFDKTAAELSMDDQIVTQLGISSSPIDEQPKGSPLSQKSVEEKKLSLEKPHVIKPSEVDFGLTIKGNESSQKSSTEKKDFTKSSFSGKEVAQKNEQKIENAKEVYEKKQIVPEKKDVVLEMKQNFSTKPYFSSSSGSSSPTGSSSKSFFSNSLSPNSSVGNDSNVDDLWKKGIVVAVNSRLSEMKKLKEDIDSIVQEKVDSSVRKELQQFKVLLDSQKGLLLSSNKAALEEKQREITFIIDAKIAELRQYNKQLSENLVAMEQAKSEQQVALQQIQQTLEDAKKVKVQLVVEMNSELIKSKASAQAFIEQSDKHMKDLDDRINRTLELEKNIAEGMLQQAEQKIESLTMQKADELVEELEVKLNKLKSIESELNPEIIQQKIQVLDEFKKQFVVTMKDNINQINSSINELNQKNSELDSQIREKILVIDAKIEELSRFEKDFTNALETTIGK